MDDRQHCNLAAIFEDHVHNDIRTFDELARAVDKSGSPHMGERIQFQPIDALLNSPNHIGCGTWIVLRNPLKNTIEIVSRCFADNDLHTP